MCDVGTLVSGVCLIALPVFLKVIYDSFRDGFDYYNRNQTKEEEKSLK